MDIKLLSKIYDVRKIEDTDVLLVFHLCEMNPQYYRYCPPAVSVNGIKDDMQALPPGKTLADKYCWTASCSIWSVYGAGPYL